MSKRTFQEIDDSSLVDVASGSERYTEDQKVIYFENNVSRYFIVVYDNTMHIPSWYYHGTGFLLLSINYTCSICIIFQVAIIQACLKHPKRLFEKFDRNLDRHTQQDAWTEIINDLANSGIFISDTQYLRKRVSNWIQRATVHKTFDNYAIMLHNYELTI